MSINREETATEQVNSDDAHTSQGPTEEQLGLLANLENYGPAPELNNELWLNTEPLRLAGLRGKVVLVEFWTFG